MSGAPTFLRENPGGFQSSNDVVRAFPKTRLRLNVKLFDKIGFHINLVILETFVDGVESLGNDGETAHAGQVRVPPLLVNKNAKCLQAETHLRCSRIAHCANK